MRADWEHFEHRTGYAMSRHAAPHTWRGNPLASALAWRGVARLEAMACVKG